jgi:hypothetical protein
MANKRGTQLVRIPIQFHIGSYKLDWKIVRVGDAVMFAGICSTSPLEHIPFGDAWELVRQYLSVKADDEQSVLEFLEVHGEFDMPKGSIRSEHVRLAKSPVTLRDKHHPGEVLEEHVFESFSLQEFAMIQDYVRRLLITGNPTLPTPWQARDVERYEIAFAGSRAGSQAHVSVYHTFPVILATVQFKLAQGAKFRTCYRKDCRLPFEVTSRHPRRFCTQYCAHITSLRQRRKVLRKSKKEERER